MKKRRTGPILGVKFGLRCDDIFSLPRIYCGHSDGQGVLAVSGYAGLVMILHFMVELLLLMGTACLYGRPVPWGRVLLGAGLGGLYAGTCLLSRFSFLSAIGWHLISILGVGMIAFGISAGGLRMGAVFLLFNLALDGIASGFSGEGLWCLAVGAVIILLMCLVGFRFRSAGEYVPVELTYNHRHLHIMALHDTGNTLLDPVTGRPVLIVGADTAYQLTGLTQQQLRSPLEAMVTAKIPGLRLIPFHTVGQSTGFMLALKIQEVKIGNKKGSCLVAFAPEGLREKSAYQALTGGVA